MVDHITDEDLNEVVARAEEAADAWVRGDMTRYLELVHHAPGFSVMRPNGGPATVHQDRHAELQQWETPFADGAATLQHATSHAWEDTIVVAMIERQHGRIGDQPDRDLSMRVTHVYRREGDDWLLVHRHADPLTSTSDLP